MDELPKISDSKPAAPQENAPKTESDKIDAIAERIIAAFAKINRANRKADAAENERNHSREQRRFKVEILEITLIAIYAFVTVLEWRTFDSERVTMESEFRSSQANFQMQLAEMKRSREDDERAWVGLSGVVFTLPYQTNFVDVVSEVMNTGKTPATIESVIKEIEMTDHITTNIVCLYTNTGEFVIAPGDKIFSELIDSTIGEKDFELLTERKEELHFMWKTTYLDAFNNVRHTDYGFIVKGPASDMATGKVCLPYGKPRMD
jgi:hypothetical protein